VEGARAVFRILSVFAPIPFFWMVFDQKASAWIVQAKQMNLQVGLWTFEPSQLQFINPALVMLLIPFATGVAYPAFERLGYPLKPLRRMTIGLFFAAASFVLVALIQVALDQGSRLSVLWQAVPYVVLTLGEILVSTTGLEFAYTQAPGEMKGTIMSFWMLAVAAGNLVVAVISRLNIFTGAASFLFYAFLVSVAGLALALIARGYQEVEFFRGTAAPASAPDESFSSTADLNSNRVRVLR
jgi:POT family proton-dependent oligopeptide transporter